MFLCLLQKLFCVKTTMQLTFQLYTANIGKMEVNETNDWKLNIDAMK